MSGRTWLPEPSARTAPTPGPQLVVGLVGGVVSVVLAALVVFSSAIPTEHVGSVAPLLRWLRNPVSGLVVAALAVTTCCCVLWPMARRTRRPQPALVMTDGPAQPLVLPPFPPRLSQPRPVPAVGSVPPPTVPVRRTVSRPTVTVPAFVHVSNADGGALAVGALVARALTAPAIAGRPLTAGLPTQRRVD